MNRSRHNNRGWGTRLLACATFVFVFVGFASCLAPFYAHLLPDSFELPLGDPHGLAVDEEGRIYCGLGAYGRVQVYGSTGSVLRGVKVDWSAGAFRIRLDNSGNLEVASTRGQTLEVFSPDGKLI